MGIEPMTDEPTLAELQAETLSQKHMRLAQAKCAHQEIYSSSVTSAHGTFSHSFCFDCGKSWNRPPHEEVG